MATLTLQSIDAIISPQATAGVVKLDAATFGDDANMQSLLGQYFAETNGTITISAVKGYTYQPNEYIVFSGNGSGGAFDKMSIQQVLITMDTSKPESPVPQLAIDAIPPANWTLSNAFPSINSPAVSLLTYKSDPDTPIFFWASYTSDEDNTVTGFYFQGEAELIPPFDFINQFLGAISEPIMCGQISMMGSTNPDNGVAQYVPNAMLEVDINDAPFKIGPFEVVDTQLVLTLSPQFNTFDKRWQTHSSIGIKTKISFNGGWMNFEVDINDPASDIMFTADLDADIGGALAELAKFVGVDNLEIPGFSVQNPDTIKLKDVQLSLNPKAGSINFITVDMGTDPNEKWTLWDGVFLEDIAVQFKVVPGNQEVDGSFSGVVSDWLKLSASFSNKGAYTFYGGLNQPVKIKDVYQFFAGQPNDDLPDMDISTLFVQIIKSSPTAKPSIEGDITIDTQLGPWVIVENPVQIGLRGLMFDIQYNTSEALATEEPGVNNSILAGAMFDVGNYSFSVQAAYKTDDGWTFDGSMTLEGNSDNISTFGTEVNNLFKIKEAPGLPSMLLDWYIPQITAHFNTKPDDKTKDLTFTFTCELKNSDVKDLDVNFKFQVTNTDTANTLEFDGTAVYTGNGLNMEFDLVIKEVKQVTPPSNTFSIEASYQAASPPKLSDLLVAVSNTLGVDADLPAALDLDAEANGLAVEVVKKDQDATMFEAAGDFGFQIAGSDWELYAAYTNNTHFEGSEQPAMVDGKLAYVLGVAVSGVMDLSKLPLVGKIPGVDKLKIDKLGFYYTNAQFDANRTKLLFEVPALQSKDKLAPEGTDASLTQNGFNLLAVFGSEKPGSGTGTPIDSMGSLPLPVETSQPSGDTPSFSPNASIPKSPIKWLNINKTFGPVSLEKVGFSFGKPEDPSTQLGEIGLYLDGSFKIAGLSMALDALGVSFMLPKPSSGSAAFNPIADTKFHLGGMFVDYQAPDFQIGGGFLSLPGGSVNFVGEFIVQAGEFGLQAYGGFTNELPHPSLFIFAHLELPIGGPPFFFIKGISGGFGINRSFKLPTFDQLTNYPLMPNNSTIPTGSQLTGTPKDKLDKMMSAMASLAYYIPPEEGQYWVAVGLDVSSFEMINVSAVLSVAFGVDFQVALIGNANMTFPLEKNEEGGLPPLAYISIDFEVSVSPATGLFQAIGVLTPDSYIYASFVHISGGFAFLAWFAGEHKGNFLVTIGGYNNSFNKPDFYPSVPRLQIRFGLDSLNVTGDAYFALTPSMFMAGFGIHATWSLGPIQAYFDAGMDFIINWKPFHYYADGYIHIGISLVIKIWFIHIRITIHVGVDLEVWGPKFGGKATVDLDIVSFTIHFGDSPNTKDVKWADVQQLIPDISSGSANNPPKVRSAHAVEFAALAVEDNPPLGFYVNINVYQKIGLVKEFTDADRIDDLDWLISPNYFELQTKSSMPCTDSVIAIEKYENDKPQGQGVIDLANSIAGGTTTYVNPDPDSIKESVKEEIEAGKEYPFFGYQTPTSGKAWNTQTYGVVPMNVAQVKSVHYVTVQEIGGEVVNDLIYLLETDSVANSIWGSDGTNQAGNALKADSQVTKNALVGFRIIPAIFFPKRTSYIEYYYLVFDVNNLFLFQSPSDDTPPAINNTAYSEADTQLIDANMASGTLFGSVNSGPFTGTAPRRANVVSELQALGFGQLLLSNDAMINTENYVDEPILCYMSGTDENDFASLN